MPESTRTVAGSSAGGQDRSGSGGQDRPDTRIRDRSDTGGRGLRDDRSNQPLRAHWDPTEADEGTPIVQRPSRRARPARTARKQSRLGRFVATYGWRAYLLPILMVVTLLVAYDAWTGSGDDATDSAGDTIVVPGFGELTDTEESTDVIGVPPTADGSFAGSIPSGELPAGGPFTAEGLGDWHIVPGTTEQVGLGRGRVYTYTVEIEDGIDTTSFGGDEAFARMVDSTLANPKSWIGDERFGFRRIDVGEPDFRVSLTSQMSVRPACGYDIPLEVSCYNPSIGRVVLNEPRWVRGAIAFQGDIGSYRQYLINHEVGHAIGYAAHQPCENADGLAPIMMQQTFGTANDDIAALDPAGVVPMDGLVCRYNPWPYPRT